MSLGADYTPPVVTNDAPNAAAMDLIRKFDEIDAIIWRDGGCDPMEQRVISAWFAKTEMRIQGMQQQQMAAGAGGMPPGAGPQQFTPSPRVPGLQEEPMTMSGRPMPEA